MLRKLRNKIYHNTLTDINVHKIIFIYLNIQRKNYEKNNYCLNKNFEKYCFSKKWFNISEDAEKKNYKTMA